MSDPTIAVIGNGWAALGAVGFLAQSGAQVRWIAGTGSRMLAPVSSLEMGAGLAAWRSLSERLGIAAGEVETGCFLREFRNRSFREPLWAKAPNVGARTEVRDESLWAPERLLAPTVEGCLALPIGELEERIRAAVCAFPQVKRTEGIPVSGFRYADDCVRSVVLASGEEISCEGVIFADRWSSLSSIEGLPKSLPFMQGREPLGALQAIFTHPRALDGGVRESFLGALHKEPGEEIQRHLWGYFTEGGMRSVWTLLISDDEADDNHEIAKKLRRMKQTLDRMFADCEWLANLRSEQVRFEEGLLYASGELPVQPITTSKAPGVSFVTDGYGPASALYQVALLLGPDLGIDLQLDSALFPQEPSTAGTSPEA